MKRYSFVLVALGAATALLAQTADLSFDQLKTRYETALTQIRADSLTTYSNLLAGVVTAYQKKGDLDGYEVVLKERKRYDAEKSLPSAEEKSSLAGKLGETFVQRLMAIEQDRDKRAADLARIYIGRLKALMPVLLTANRLDDAKRVKTEMDKAEFMSASSEAGIPKTVAADAAPRIADKKLPPDDAAEYEGHHYLAVMERVAWRDAKKACEARGGHLIHIETPAEDEFAKGLCKMKPCWIGVTSEGWANKRFDTKTKQLTDFRLASAARSLQYRGWLDGRPDLHASYDYVYIGVGSLGGVPNRMGWADGVNADSAVVGYICEWDK